MSDAQPVEIDALDPDIRRFVTALNEGYGRFPNFGQLPLPERRAAAEQVRAPWRAGGPRMLRSIDVQIAGRAGRIHVPVAAGLSPALLYLHGGGWTMFSIDTHDRLMREYAARAGIIVVGIDYSLSPEAKYPIALNEVVAAIGWLRSDGAAYGIDGMRLAVGGDSAGANLAIAAALKLRGSPGAGTGPRSASAPALRGMLLNYGVYSPEPSDSYVSYDGPRYMLTVEEMRYFWSNYVRDPADLRDPYVAPYLADVAGLPPALFNIAACDILADSNRAMAAKLAAAGVPTVVEVYAGASHSFLEAMSIAPLSGRALDVSARWLGLRLFDE